MRVLKRNGKYEEIDYKKVLNRIKKIVESNNITFVVEKKSENDLVQ